MIYIVLIILLILLFVYFRKKEKFSIEFPEYDDSRVNDQRGKSNLFDKNIVYPEYVDMVKFGLMTTAPWKLPDYVPNFPN